MSRCAVAVMARAPSSPGKTRLSSHFSESRLRALRAALLADTLLVLAAVPDVDRYIFFTPNDGEEEIAALAAGGRFELVAQRGGDLGQRMESAVQELVVSRGCASAILVGADIPLMTAACLIEARETLESNGGVVIGPADDGGYYLIGMRELHPSLFRDIEWGGASVLTDTLSAASRAGIKSSLIRGAYDIDTIEDVRRLQRELEAFPIDVAPNTRMWLAGPNE